MKSNRRYIERYF